MPTKSKAKKAKPAKATKAKTAPKKSNSKKLSKPMKAGLAAVAAMPVRKESKLEAIIKLLKRAEGATIEDMVAATGWQQHTIEARCPTRLPRNVVIKSFPTNRRENSGFIRLPLSQKVRSKVMRKQGKNGYAVHNLESQDGKRLMKCHQLIFDDIKKAVDIWNQESKLPIRTVIGVGNDGLIGSERSGWHPDLPDAFSHGLVMIPWIQILELLKRAPDGATGIFLSNPSSTKQ
jgi:hypothetical protein